MKPILVWDLPTRLMHWAFAASVSGSLVIALTVDGESPLFQLHMILGLVAAFIVVLRLVWGLVGTRHARFANFPLSPGMLADYGRGLLQSAGRRFTGHNPGAAWASLAMFTLVGLLLLTGLGPGGEAFEEVHGALAYALLGVVGLHLAGLAWHTVRHRENIAASMVTGRKEGDPAEEIRSARPVWAVGLLAGGIVWIAGLFRSHDANAATVRIPVLGAVVQLGESESEGGEDSERGSQKKDDDDDDD